MREDFCMLLVCCASRIVLLFLSVAIDAMLGTQLAEQEPSPDAVPRAQAIDWTEENF